MKKLIAVTGTHGAGKTTLTYLIAAHYKSKGKNVKLIQEVARSCPFPINEKMTADTALWIYFEHSKKELEALKDHDIVIADRTFFDSFVYAKYFNIEIDQRIINSSFRLYHYDEILFVRPAGKILDDGVRSIDETFQQEIDLLFYKELKNIPYKQVSTLDIFNGDMPWKAFCL